MIVSCALAIVLGVLASCGGDDEPTNSIPTLEPKRTASSPSPDPETARNSEGCRLLTPAERRSIAGENLETVAPLPVVKGALLCRWVKTLSTSVTTSIRVISQPVQRWVQTLPAEIDRVIASGKANDKFTNRLKVAKTTILRGADEVSNKQACSYFSLLVEVNDKTKKGLNEALLYQGTVRGDYTVGWQRCGGGVHTDLLYEEPGLQISLALSQSVIRLGKIAHRRAVDKLQ